MAQATSPAHPHPKLDHPSLSQWVTDASLLTITKTYSITVSGNLTIVSPATLPAGTLNAAYAPITITASGGAPPYTWTATGLPSGLSITVATGVISGTPTTATGSPYSVKVTVTDSTGKTASMSYSLNVSSLSDHHRPQFAA